MADVQVSNSEQHADGYRFDVTVSQAGHRSEHVVTLSNDDYERWASEGMSPTAVARRCVELLLRRVPQTDLLERFDLREAVQFYPAFERETHRQFE